METVYLVLQLLVVLATQIPFIIALVTNVKKAVKEKNWKALLNEILKLIQQAETTFDSGATRKEWVMEMAKTLAGDLNYDLNEGDLSRLIDNLVAMAKKVNVQIEGAETFRFSP